MHYLVPSTSADSEPGELRVCNTFGPSSLALLDCPLWHFDLSRGSPLLVEWPSTLTHDRPLWLKRPSTIVLDRPLRHKWPPVWFKTVHFRATVHFNPLRTVHFHPFGPSTLDLTRVNRKYTILSDCFFIYIIDLKFIPILIWNWLWPRINLYH